MSDLEYEIVCKMCEASLHLHTDNEDIAIDAMGKHLATHPIPHPAQGGDKLLAFLVKYRGKALKAFRISVAPKS